MTLHTYTGTMQCGECGVTFGRSVDHFNDCKAAAKRGYEYREKLRISRTEAK